MTKSELIEKYAAMVPRYVAIDRLSGNSKGELIFDGEAITDLFTRLLSEYDAQRSVEGWEMQAALDIMEKAVAPFIAHIRTPSETGAKIAALIASHAPKGVDEEAAEILTRFAAIIRSSAPDSRLRDVIKKALEWFDDAGLLPMLQIEYTPNAYKETVELIDTLRAALSETKAVCPEGVCPACWGTGNVMHSHVNQCSQCNGTGLPISVKEK